MAMLYTGGEGVPLNEILNILGNKDYPTIMVRCLWEYNNELYDDLMGYCKYENGKLEALDGDEYSLDDLYIKWEETDDYLIIWEHGSVE